MRSKKPNRRLDFLSCAGFNAIRKDHERDSDVGLTFILHNTVQDRLIGDIDWIIH